MAEDSSLGRWPLVVAVLIVIVATLLTEQVGSVVEAVHSDADGSTSPMATTHDDSREGPTESTTTSMATEDPVVVPSPTESRSPTEDDFAAAELTEQLAAAFAERNVDLLLDLLHPFVLDTYSREECVAHLEAAIAGLPPLRLGRVMGTGSYEYVTSNRTVTEVADAVFVVLVFETESGPVEEHSQFAWADGTLRWFTHCTTGA